MRHILAKKINADSWLHNGVSTLSLSSNLLFTNRSMMQVFPVLLSPRRMTLNVLFPMVEEVIDMLLYLKV